MFNNTSSNMFQTNNFQNQPSNTLGFQGGGANMNPIGGQAPSSNMFSNPSGNFMQGAPGMQNAPGMGLGGMQGAPGMQNAPGMQGAPGTGIQGVPGMQGQPGMMSMGMGQGNQGLGMMNQMQGGYQMQNGTRDMLWDQSRCYDKENSFRVLSISWNVQQKTERDLFEYRIEDYAQGRRRGQNNPGGGMMLNQGANSGLNMNSNANFAPTVQPGGLFNAPATNIFNPQANQPPGGNLFNSNPQQPNNTGGSNFFNNNSGMPGGNQPTNNIFNNSSTPGGGGGLFNNQPAQNTQGGGGLFNNASTSIPNTGGGGLFNNNSATPNNSGLFNNSTQPQNTGGGGLFNNNNQQPSNSGLFNTTPNTNAPNNSGGLFGPSATAKPPTGGLFGPSTSNTGGGGLFNNNSGGGGGLFNNTNNNPGQSTGLFNNNSSAPSGGLFGPQPSPNLTAQIGPSQPNAFQPNPMTQSHLMQQGQQPLMSPYQMPGSQYPNSQQYGGYPMPYDPYMMMGMGNPMMSMYGMMNPMMMPGMMNPMYMGMFGQYRGDKDDDEKKDKKDKNKENKANDNLLDIKSFTTNQDTLLKKPFKNEVINPLNRKLLSRTTVMKNMSSTNKIGGINNRAQNLNEISHYRQFEIYEELEDRSITNCNMSIKSSGFNFTNLNLNFEMKDLVIPVQTRYTDQIVTTIKKYVSQLKTKLEETNFVRNKFLHFYENDGKTVKDLDKLHYKYKGNTLELDSNYTWGQLGIEKSSATITVIYRSVVYNIDSEDDSGLGFNQQITSDMLPKIEAGYTTEPSLDDMKKMTINKLKKFKKFKIKKDFVSITFENEIDLVGANVADFIVIRGKNFEVDFTLEKDASNHKILSDLLVEIEGMGSKQGKDQRQMESYLKKKTQYELFGTFESYDLSQQLFKFRLSKEQIY